MGAMTLTSGTYNAVTSHMRIGSIVTLVIITIGTFVHLSSSRLVAAIA